jgi:hypothetical protein
MKIVSNEKPYIHAEAEDGTIAYKSYKRSGAYTELATFTDRDDALCVLWGLYRHGKEVLYCSDKEALKLHEREVALDD